MAVTTAPRLPPASPRLLGRSLPVARALGNASCWSPPTRGRSGPAKVRAHRGAGSNLRRCLVVPNDPASFGGQPATPRRPPPACCCRPRAARAPPIPGPWPSGVRPSRSRSACPGSGCCSATSPKSRRSGPRRRGRLGPANAGATRRPWRSLRLRPANDAAAGTAARSGRVWSRESHLPESRRKRESSRPRTAATGWGARAARGEPAGRTAR